LKRSAKLHLFASGRDGACKGGRLRDLVVAMTKLLCNRSCHAIGISRQRSLFDTPLSDHERISRLPNVERPRLIWIKAFKLTSWQLRERSHIQSSHAVLKKYWIVKSVS